MRGGSAKKIECLGSRKENATNREKTVVAMELRQKYPLKVLLKVLDLSKTTYYYNRKIIDKGDRNADLKAKIKEIYEKNKGRYGYRRITPALDMEGIHVNHKKVQRLMKEMGLHGITPRARYRSYRGDMKGTVKNLLLTEEYDEESHKKTYRRDFSADSVNEKWTTDISEFHIASGKLYLSPVMDMYNGEIVAYDISDRPNYAQIDSMLKMAFDKYDDLDGLIMHSDQGWQYQMKQYHKALKDKGIIQSMSRKGNCKDNSPMECFFGRMKNEMFYGHEYEFKSLDQLRKEMEEYIRYYNEDRIKLNLKGLTPLQVRNQTLK